MSPCKFPPSPDIAVVCDRAVTVGALEDCIRRGAKGLLKDVSLFDIYTGSGIPEGKKSVAFSLTFRAPDRTLTDEEVQAAMDKVTHVCAQKHGATVRA